MKLLRILIIACLLINSGCVAFYKRHEVLLSVQEVGRNIPASNYPVIIQYNYDHYNVRLFRIWNAPKPIEARTNESGMVTLKVATFCRPYLVVGSTQFSLDKNVIVNGGTPSKHLYRGKDEEIYRRHRELHPNNGLPEKIYPEVDVTIKNPPNSQ